MSTAPRAFTIAALAVADGPADAVGVVQLACEEAALALTLLRAGAYRRDFVPGTLAEVVTVHVPYSAVRGLVRRSRALVLTLDRSVPTPFHRFALARFTDDPAETLAPERPLPKRGSALLPLACGGALWLLALLVQGIGLDPGADATAWLPTLLGLPAAVASWCAMWALMSKLFQHRFDFAGHLRIALPWLLALEAISLAVPQLGATLGWPWLWQLTSPLGALGGALLIRAHLVHVLPHQVRALTAAVAAALLVGGGISLHLTHRSTDRYTRAPYMSTLPLPALHWASREPAASLVAEMAPLAASLARRVQKAREDDAEDDEEGGGD